MKSKNFQIVFMAFSILFGFYLNSINASSPSCIQIMSNKDELQEEKTRTSVAFENEPNPESPPVFYGRPTIKGSRLSEIKPQRTQIKSRPRSKSNTKVSQKRTSKKDNQKSKSSKKQENQKSPRSRQPSSKDSKSSKKQEGSKSTSPKKSQENSNKKTTPQKEKQNKKRQKSKKESKKLQNKNPKIVGNETQMKILENYQNNTTYNLSGKRQRRNTIREDLLAEPNPQAYKDLLAYKKITSPKIKAKRISEIAAEKFPMSTKEVGKIIQREKLKELKKKKNRALRQKYYLKIVKKIQAQTKSQLMDEIIDRFVDFVAYRSMTEDQICNEIDTEAMRILMLVIKKYAFLVLSPKACFWYCDQSPLDALSRILADLIFGALCQLQKEEENECEKELKQTPCQKSEFQNDIHVMYENLQNYSKSATKKNNEAAFCN